MTTRNHNGPVYPRDYLWQRTTIAPSWCNEMLSTVYKPLQATPLRHCAATTLQARARGGFARRRAQAQRRLQRWARRWITTLPDRQRLVVLRCATARLQRAYRASRERRARAGVVLVRWYKWLVRQRDVASTRIQRAWKSARARRTLQTLCQLRALRERNAVRRVQRAFRTRSLTHVKECALRRLYKATARVRTQSTRLHEQEATLACLEWAHCPITHEPIRHPAWCKTDGRVYEQEALSKWVHQKGQSPCTRASTKPEDLLQHQKAATPSRTWMRFIELSRSIRCTECDRKFKASKFGSSDDLLKAYLDHVQAKHHRVT